jgi:hypothetical protein
MPVQAKSRTVTRSFEGNNPKKFALQTTRLKRRSNIVVIVYSRMILNILRKHRFVNPICMSKYISRILNSSRSGQLPGKCCQFSFLPGKGVANIRMNHRVLVPMSGKQIEQLLMKEKCPAKM